VIPTLLLIAQPLADIAFEQKLGAQVPIDLEVIAEDGSPTTLRSAMAGKPAILALAYYECPMLCTLVLNGLAGALRVVSLDPGRDFQVVILSIDPKETPELARKKKTSIVKRFARAGTDDGFRLLVAEEASIRSVAESIGFSYRWDERTRQWAHASGFVVLTPSGVVAQYFYGVEFSPRDLRLALVEASEGRTGELVDHVLLYCFQYDPETGKYGLAIMRLIRIAGIVTVLGLGLTIGRTLAREGRWAKSSA
jgi:protein SCO1/2